MILVADTTADFLKDYDYFFKPGDSLLISRLFSTLVLNQGEVPVYNRAV